MKGIVITSNLKVSVQDFGEPWYETVGIVVGGYIELVHPRELPHPYVMLVNEDGHFRNLQPNPIASALYGSQSIVGNVVIMQEGFVDGEPDIVGLDEKQIPALLDRFCYLANLCREVTHV